MSRCRPLCCALVVGLVSLVAAPAWAHYLWISIDQKAGEHGTVNVYFEEGPRAGDGHYLDPIIKTGATWIRTLDSPEATVVATQEVKHEEQNKRWIAGQLPAAGPRSVDSYGRYGVYRYGQTDVLLHYYARVLDVRDRESLQKLAAADPKNMKLDVVAGVDGEELVLTVRWQGEPAAGRPVIVRGAGGFAKTVKTDESGQVRLEPAAEGRYLVRTHVELQTPGEYEGKAYQLVRHHATLNLTLPVK